MTPIALTRQIGEPVFPLVEVDGSGDLKRQVLERLEAHGVTCERILQVMDDVKADPGALARWFVVR